MTINLAGEGSVLDAKTLVFPQSTVKTVVPTLCNWFIPPILEEEEGSVKDSVTSKLPSREQIVGGEASGYGGQPALSTMGQPKIYERVVEDADVEEKLAPIAKENKTKKEVDNGSDSGIFMVVEGVLDSN